MAYRRILGFETGDLSEATAVSTSGGTVAYSTTQKRTGLGSLKIISGTNFGYFRFQAYDSNGASASFAASTLYTTFWIWRDTLPSSASEEIYVSETGAALRKFSLRINSAGKLSCWDQTGTTQLGSDGATTVPTGQWVRIDAKSGTESGAGANDAAYEVKINGTSELSGTGSLREVVNGRSFLGKVINRNSQTYTIYYDDVFVDDAAYCPNDGGVEVMQIDGAGTYSGWAVGTYTSIDELPADGATTEATHITTAAALTGTLESAASAGISGTVNAVQSHYVVHDDGITASALKLRLRSGSTDDDTTARNVGTTYELQGKLYATDPATSAAWVLSALDSLEVGAAANATGSLVSCTAAFVMVHFLAAAGDTGLAQPYQQTSQPAIETFVAIPY